MHCTRKKDFSLSHLPKMKRIKNIHDCNWYIDLLNWRRCDHDIYLHIMMSSLCTSTKKNRTHKERALQLVPTIFCIFKAATYKYGTQMPGKRAADTRTHNSYFTIIFHYSYHLPLIHTIWHTHASWLLKIPAIACILFM